MASEKRFALQRAKAFTMSFPRGQMPVVTVQCHVRGCQEKAETHTKPEMPPLVIAKRFRRLGWEVDNEATEATCPGHVRGKRRKNDGVPAPLPSADEAAQTMRAALSLVPTPMPAFPHEEPPIEPTAEEEDADMPPGFKPHGPPSEFPHEMAEAAKRALDRPPTSDARKAQFAANRMLDEHYSEDLRRYEPGWSDARIAAETGAAETWVAETREAVYGPMGDPEVEALEARLADVCSHYRQEIEGLRDLIVKAEQTFAAKLADIRNRLQTLQQNRGK